jgi:hypothetical protein
MRDKDLLVYNGLFVEVERKDDFWGNDTIFIYDGLSDASKDEINAIKDYLYNEGFTQDRRTRCEVLRSENFD